jgi:hypothetical protein
MVCTKMHKGSESLSVAGRVRGSRGSSLRRLGATLAAAGVIWAWSATTPAWAQNNLAVMPADRDSTLIPFGAVTAANPVISGQTFVSWAQQSLISGGASTVQNASFYFQQCYGGGFLQDLQTPLGNRVDWAGGSASTWAQPSVGQVSTEENKLPMPTGGYAAKWVADPPQDFWTKALYPTLTAANTVISSVNTARNNDQVGINGATIAPAIGSFETGQTYGANPGNDFTSRTQNANLELAILWAGNANSMRHLDDVVNVYNTLTNLWNGKTPYKIEVLFGNGTTYQYPGMAAPMQLSTLFNQPATTIQMATSANLQADITGIHPTLQTQFVFYASDHGGFTVTPPGAPVVVPKNGTDTEQFSLSSQDVRAIASEGPGGDPPTLTLDYTGLKSAVSVELNGFTLGTLNPTQDQTVLSIPAADLSTSDTISIFNSTASGFTLTSKEFFSGDINTGPVVPEPSTWVLGVLAALSLIGARGLRNILARGDVTRRT